MKNLLFSIGIIFLIVAALATPVAIGLGLYDWVANDNDFKFALWYGFKVWISIFALGIFVGFPCLAAGK